MEKIKYTVDRIEEGLAVLVDEEMHERVLPAELIEGLMGKAPQADDMLMCETDGGEIISAEYLEEETKATEADMKSRLAALFARNKK